MTKLMTIVEGFQTITEQYPTKVALCEKERKMTYQELDSLSNQLANRILALGVKQEEMIGIPNKKSIEFVVGILAILKAGCSYVPMDQNYPEKRLQFMVNDTEMNYYLNFSSDKSVFPYLPISPIAFSIDDVKEDNPIRFANISPSSLAYAIYTSGSTGNPKGVLIEHSSVVNIALASKMIKINNDNIVAQFSNLCFDAATYEIWGSLLNGACLYILANEYTSFDDWKLAIKEGRVDIAFFTTGLFNAIVDQDPSIFSGLQKMIIGGETISYYHVNIFKEHNEDITLIHAYGPTECTTFSLCYEVVEKNQEIIPIGFPLDNVEVKIITENGDEASVGEVGEINIAGSGVMRGYLNQPTLTSEVLVVNSENGNLYYKTGDYGIRLKNNAILYKGRKDNQVKIRGFRIELHEIQEKLDQYSQIKQAVVTVKTINNEKYIVVYYTHPENIEEELRTYLKNELPHFMIPHFFVKIEKFPLNQNGKVDKKELLKIDVSHNSLSEASEENEQKKEILSVWQKILGNEKFSMDDNFFECGGHSILATKLVYVLKERFYPEASLQIFLENSTVNSFVDALESQNDLVMQTVLENDAQLSNQLIKQIKEIKQQRIYDGNILLTGATGFLGAHLLYKLLSESQDEKVHCLVRFPSKGRIETVLKKYQLWKDEFKSRIITIEGDLSKENFGLDIYSYKKLSEDISTIYHIGAETNFFEPYSKSKKANLHGIKEIISFASSSKQKHIYYASTLSVLTGEKTWDEKTELEYTDDLIIGYSQSKWAAEKMLLQAKDVGLTVDIFRLGRISSNASNGIWNDHDMLYKVFETFIEQRILPFEEEIFFELMPVDFVSDFIYKLSIHHKENKIGQGEIYHIYNDNKVSSNFIIEFLENNNLTYTNMSFEEWLKTLKIKTQKDEIHSLSALSQLIDESTQLKDTKIKQDLTLLKMEEISLKMPEIDYQYIELFLSLILNKSAIKS